MSNHVLRLTSSRGKFYLSAGGATVVPMYRGASPLFGPLLLGLLIRKRKRECCV